MKINYEKFHGNDLEDKFIYENFDLPEHGVFVDVGAGPDGIQGSNTYFFERNGWTGLTIDGDPRAYPLLTKNRNTAIKAVISSSKDEVNYHMNELTSDLSGIRMYKDNLAYSVKVTPRTLEEILDEHKIEKIDLLSVDTEGTETDVLKSFDIDKYKPTIVIIEYITQGLIDKNAGDYLLSKGYELFSSVGANLIFKRQNNDIDNN